MANSTPARAADTLSGAVPQTGLLNEHEAAQALGLSVKTLRRWRWAGRPPAFVKIGRAVRYDPAVIEGLIAAGRRVSTSDPGKGMS